MTIIFFRGRHCFGRGGGASGMLRLVTLIAALVACRVCSVCGLNVERAAIHHRFNTERATLRHRFNTDTADLRHRFNTDRAVITTERSVLGTDARVAALESTRGAPMVLTMLRSHHPTSSPPHCPISCVNPPASHLYTFLPPPSRATLRHQFNSDRRALRHWFHTESAALRLRFNAEKETLRNQRADDSRSSTSSTASSTSTTPTGPTMASNSLSAGAGSTDSGGSPAGGGGGSGSSGSSGSSSSSDSNSAALGFLRMAGQLKTVKRTGWVYRGVEGAGTRVESVADHSWRMAAASFLLTGAAVEHADDGE